MANINRVVLVGNLTRDPELRHTPSGTSVCKLRLAVNSRQKDAATGEWGEKPNYFLSLIHISEKGKIRSRRITGACRRHQNQVSVAVKRAREMALLPYVGER